MTESLRESPQLAERPQISLKKKLAFGLISVGLFALLLLAVEVALRVFVEPLSSLNSLVTTPEQREQAAKSSKSPIFDGDPRLLWRLKPNLDKVYWDYTSVSTNAQGFRAESSERGLLSKKEGSIRIVCLGDSVTFGYRTPLAYPGAPTNFDPNWVPYPMLLERHLRAANPGKEIEVVTMAVPGYTSTQGRAWIEQEIDILKPDMITASFGWNDASLTLIPDREVMTDDRSTYFFRWLSDKSQIYARLAAWLKEMRATPNGTPAITRPLESRTNTEEYIQNMAAISQLAQDRRIPYLAISPTLRDDVEKGGDVQQMVANRRALRQWAADTGGPILEIYELTEAGHPLNQALFGERIHPSFAGHRLLAERLVRYISDQRLFSDLQVPPFVP